MTVGFSKPLAANTVTAANFQLQDAGGQSIASTKLQLRDGNRLVEITYARQVAGSYQLVINGPAVTDRVGNALGDMDAPNSTLGSRTERRPKG